VADIGTKAEREKPVLRAYRRGGRYPGPQAYIDLIKRALDELIKEEFLLPEDGEGYVEGARRKNPFDPKVAIEPLGTPGHKY
jgi:hypothetical protein